MMSSRHPTPEFCWACNCGLTSDIYVWLNQSVIVPCCKSCWEQMPIEQRLRVAQMLIDRADGGVIDAIATVFRSSLGRFIEEQGGHEWFRGRGN
jgi:hypothetical protein